MGKKTDFSVDYAFVGLLCLVCIPLGYQHFLINPKIQSPTPQEKQPSAQITKATIDSGFKRFKDFLEQPVSRCVIEGRVENNRNHDRACKGFIIGLSLLNSLSRQ